MKIKWETPKERLPETEPINKPEKKASMHGVTVGHNQAEMFIRFGDATIILPPEAAKEFYNDLQTVILDWEEEYGKIPKLKEKKKRKRESVPKRVLKELYRSKKIGSKLISINTSKRKHLRFKGD
ncbi:MAG: hypothetical protein P9X24_04290 [Candidatus Hatepunaea meridiana]|nr:hypothetical protein [Candidatus Hatepunaea meridiana]